MKPWRFYSVHVPGFDAALYTAPSRSKARAEAWRSFAECRDCTFKQFQQIASIRAAEAPADDGYSYVRAHYETPEIKLGDRVRLETGDGVVIYPGRSTHMIHVGRPNGVRLVVHPLHFAELPREVAA